MKEIVVLSLLLTVVPSHALYQCKSDVDGKSFDFTKLDKRRIVTTKRKTPPSSEILSWSINPCGTQYSDVDDVFKKNCNPVAQICGVKTVELESGNTYITQVISAAGDFGEKPAQISETLIDHGLRVKWKGAKWGDQDVGAEIDFLCSSEDDLNVISWDESTLKLQWKTVHACVSEEPEEPEDKIPEDPESPDESNPDEPHKAPSDSSSWGWFTWLFILLVIGFSCYVVGSAWINYNRYGLSGVELLPHSDLVRDLPYLVRDFFKKIINTFAGSNRGGYSAF